jgi:hypothetical protein
MMGTLIQTTAVALAMLSYLSVAEAQTVFAGNVSCGSWMTYRRSGTASGLEQFVLGYVSGENVMMAQAQQVVAEAKRIPLGAVAPTPNIDVLEGVDANGVFAWLDTHCAAHPTQRLTAAAIDFVHERIKALKGAGR